MKLRLEDIIGFGVVGTFAAFAILAAIAQAVR
jgi:hypothetical protein